MTGKTVCHGVTPERGEERTIAEGRRSGGAKGANARGRRTRLDPPPPLRLRRVLPGPFA